MKSKSQGSAKTVTKAPNESWTIYDIADASGVSAKTVSRVLNGKSGVGAEKREKILQLIQEVGYHPHVGARSMRGRPDGCVGVTLSAPMEVVPISQPFFLWLFAELYRMFGSQGHYVCFDMNPYEVGEVADYARGLWEQRYRACVICGPLATEDKVVHRIHAANIPYIVLSRLDSLPELSYATVDYEEASYLSTKFLLNKGHRRIAMLKAFEGYQPGVERSRGYLRALAEHDLDPDENLVRSVNFGTQSITTAVHRLMMDRSVTALVDCSGTEDGQGIREGARQAGRTPGKDFDVVCWTYTDNACVLAEACAHVWLPVREAADEGISLFGDWYYERRQGPIQVLYRPTLQEAVTEKEIAKPKHLFDMLD